MRCASSTCSTPSRVLARAPKISRIKPGSIDDLGIPRFLEIALLHRRDDVVDDDQTDFESRYPLVNFIDLSRSEQSRRPRLGQRHDRRVDDIEVDGLRKSDRLGETIFRRMDLRKRLRLRADAHLALPYRNKHEGARSGCARLFPATPALAWRLAPRVFARHHDARSTRGAFAILLIQIDRTSWHDR